MILAIDPGEHYGIAIFGDDGLQLSYGSHLWDPTSDLVVRAALYAAAIDCVVIERGGWRSKLNAYGLGRNLGVLLGRHGLEMYECTTVTPKAWKKTLCGNGNASKDEVTQAVSAMFHEYFYKGSKKATEVTQDQVDAIGIGYHAWKEMT